MKFRNIDIYTDASYDQRTKIAICGELIIDYTNPENNIYNFDTHVVNDTNNTEAELYGIILILDKFNHNHNCNLTIYTDCQMALRLVNCLKRKNNKDIYSKFYELYDKYNGKCNFVKIAGHKRKNERNDIEENFSILDKHVRKQLRFHLKYMVLPANS